VSVGLRALLCLCTMNPSQRLKRSVKRFDRDAAGPGGKGGLKSNAKGGSKGASAAKRAKGSEATAAPPASREPPHQHRFDVANEVHDVATDMWTNACTVCGHTQTYEKL
jgi:hypothetical protein